MNKSIVAVGSIAIGLVSFAASQVRGQPQVDYPASRVGSQLQNNPVTLGLRFEPQRQSSCKASENLPDCLRKIFTKVKLKKNEVQSANDRVRFEFDKLGDSIRSRQESYREIAAELREAKQLWNLYGRRGGAVKIGGVILSPEDLRKYVERLSEQDKASGSELRFLKGEYDEMKKDYDLYNAESRKLDLAIEILPAKIVVAERSGLRQDVGTTLAELEDLLSFQVNLPKRYTTPKRQG